MIQPGLERISLLLKNVQVPWKAIHVAGTNGKGSVCGYASALLTRRNIRNGRFTSPHIVDRWDCIAVNDKPVSEVEFKKVEKHFIQLNQTEGIGASEFELLTATAFQLFNEKQIEVGVIEVGMGGSLDSTNILNNQVVSVISKIAFDHQNFLGNTLEDIARHKAGILRPNVPYIVNPVNESNVQTVIDEYAKEIGAGPRILVDSQELADQLYSTKDWAKFVTDLRPFQRDNAVLGYLSFVEVLKRMNLNTIGTCKLLPPLKNQAFPGRLSAQRLQAVFVDHDREFLIDGAHNPDAAVELKNFVEVNVRSKPAYKGDSPPEGGWPVTWVLAMTDGKDAQKYLSTLMKPGDNVITTTFGPVDGMPWVKPMDPKALAKIAGEAQRDITSVAIPERGTFRALCAAKYLCGPTKPIVLTGSLYLVGDYLREKEQSQVDSGFVDIAAIDAQERHRVHGYFEKNVQLGRCTG